jgi:hypothetical protein
VLVHLNEIRIQALEMQGKVVNIHFIDKASQNITKSD